jgi:hypothetical protein
MSDWERSRDTLEKKQTRPIWYWNSIGKYLNYCQMCTPTKNHRQELRTPKIKLRLDDVERQEGRKGNAKETISSENK